MIVNEFNIYRGLYTFEFNEDFETEYHSHPAVEFIIAKNGTFTLSTGTDSHTNLTFAIIGANNTHKLLVKNCGLKVVMIEHRNVLINKLLNNYNIDFESGFYAQTKFEKEHNAFDFIVQQVMKKDAAIEYDYRIKAVIDFLNNIDFEDGLTIKIVQSVANLSASRLSHLFKSEVGISLKKYLVWARLKHTVTQHLHREEDLFHSLINNGFYDQPHFSRSFKSMLGIKPSKAYNSSTVQVLPNAKP
ncbi:MAG: helix-turn-helix domain-containing protein [Bacteroidota bacterium]